MTKKQFLILFSSLLVLILVFTNPSELNHIETVKSKLKMAFKKKMASEMIDENTDSMESLGKGIGLMLGDVFIDKIADGYISRNNYFLFSTTKAEYKGETKIIGLGILGNVFVTDKLDELFEEKDELPNEINKTENINPTSEIENNAEELDQSFNINSLSWRIINSERYNYSIELPTTFNDLGLRESLFVKYHSSDLDDFNIMIEPYGEINDKLFKEEFDNLLNTSKNVAYKTFNKKFFAISGTDDETIYYTKCIKKDDQIYYLNISYPELKKEDYNQITTRISNSFN